MKLQMYPELRSQTFITTEGKTELTTGLPIGF